MPAPTAMPEIQAERQHAITAIVEGAKVIDWMVTNCMPTPPEHIAKAFNKLMLAASILSQPELRV